VRVAVTVVAGQTVLALVVVRMVLVDVVGASHIAVAASQ